MNSNNSSYDNLDKHDMDNETDMDLIQKGMGEQAPVPAGTREMEAAEEGATAPPGPSSSKTRYRTRSRGGSITRSLSRASSATADTTAMRKSSREAARNANRFAPLADGEHVDAEGKEHSTPIAIDSDESEVDTQKTEQRQHPPKRKIKAENGEEPSSSEETTKKKGKPTCTTSLTTIRYISRADAIERKNKLAREALDLDVEKSVRRMSASEIRFTHKATVEDKLEELEMAPTEDIAQRAMQSMVEVWKVATTSKNLKGGYVKALKQAAAIGTASAEVLCQRAGKKEPSDETDKQLNTLRRELDRAKRETLAAKEETARTKKELEELRKETKVAERREGNRRRVRAVIEDSPPPSPFPCQVRLDRLDTRRVAGQGVERGLTPSPAGAQPEIEREESARASMGTSGTGMGVITRARSRSSSVSSASSHMSVSSHMSDRTAAMMAERKSRRDLAYETNRMAAAMAQAGPAVNASAIINVDSTSEENEEGKDSLERWDPTRRRKRAAEEGVSELAIGTQSKQGRGRLRTTGLYAGRAKAQEECNKQMREAAALENEKLIKILSAGQIFSRVETELDDAMSEMSSAPNADIAHQARECMAGVIKVAKCSRNLQGGYVKILKHAAVIGSASAEILRTRADNDTGTESDGADAKRQIKAMRKQLEQVTKEARLAREEAERAKAEAEQLRKELTELKGRKSGRRRRTYVKDPSASPSPEREMEGEPTGVQVNRGEEESPMDVDEVTEEAVQQPPEYDDERRRAEILPPREEWPDALRPSIRGKVKVLEDIPLVGHRVILAKKAGQQRDNAAVQPAERAAKKDTGAQTLMEQLAPLLEGWLRANLEALGIQVAKKGQVETPPAPPGKTKQKGSKKGKDDTVRHPPQTREKGPPEGSTHMGTGATTVPNSTLWSKVAAEGASTSKASATGASPTTHQPGREPWTLVGRLGKPIRDATKNRRTLPSEGPKKAPARPPARGEKSSTLRAATTARAGKNGNPNEDEKTKAPPRRRPPRSAAVTLTCPPDRYEEAMKMARTNIDLHELGIESLRPKRAATGALVLEVTGPNGAERAEALRERMAEALKPMEGVKVARPMKTADLRIRDLVEATSAEEVKEALATLGGCSSGDIRTGEVKMAPNGLGSIWAQCPLAAANKIAAAGRVKIGNWTSSRVGMLEPRQQHCYRCLQRGHVMNNCPSDTDRRNLCYRCSEPGHVAARCNSKPLCILCQERGLVASHRIGGAACKAPKARTRGGRRGKQAAEDKMDVEVESRPAVRGGPPRDASEGTPVPVRPGPIELERENMSMEVEAVPAPPQPPKEKRSPRKRLGKEEPAKKPPSQCRKE